MTTLDSVTKKKQAGQFAEQQAAVELVRLAHEQGLSLTGPEGLLKQLTKAVLETALHEEMTEHLGYVKHDPPEAGTSNIRNGTRAKTVLAFRCTSDSMTGRPTWLASDTEPYGTTITIAGGGVVPMSFICSSNYRQIWEASPRF